MNTLGKVYVVCSVHCQGCMKKSGLGHFFWGGGVGNFGPLKKVNFCKFFPLFSSIIDRITVYIPVSIVNRQFIVRI